MSAKTDPREGEPSVDLDRYYFRRSLSARELLPAVGAAVGAGLVAFYLVKLALERTPLRPELRPRGTRPRPIATRGAAGSLHHG